MPSHFSRGFKGMAQQVLQTLEGLKMVEKDQGGGHKLTPRDREIWTKWLDRWQLPTRSIRTNDVGSINCLIRVTKKKKKTHVDRTSCYYKTITTPDIVRNIYFLLKSHSDKGKRNKNLLLFSPRNRTDICPSNPTSGHTHRGNQI